MYDDNPYEVLGLEFGSDQELKGAYERMCRIYGPGSSMVLGLYTEQYRREYMRRVETAFAELKDSSKRELLLKRMNEMKAMQGETPAPDLFEDDLDHRPKHLEDDTVETVRKTLQEISIQIDEHTVFNGATLKTIRSEMGIQLSAIAQTTKISITNLRMVEEDAWNSLPAPVYIKGFLKQYAKYLGLNPGQVAESYISAMQAGTQEE